MRVIAGSLPMGGIGIGGVLTVLPIAWADYFGRRSFGSIRRVAHSIQVLAQAAGPLVSGILRDQTGDYVLPLWTFTGLSLAAHDCANAAHVRSSYVFAWRTPCVDASSNNVKKRSCNVHMVTTSLAHALCATHCK